MPLGLTPNEPTAAELAYVRDLSGVWRRAQSLIVHGVNALPWPGPRKRVAPLYSLPRGIPKPPRPATLTKATVTAQVRWMRRALRMLVNRKTLAPILAANAKRFDWWVSRDVKRTLRQDANAFGLPDSSVLLEWAKENVALIESGTIGPTDGVRLKSLLDDVAGTLVEAFEKGLPQDELKTLLMERFEVSEARAHLIARDQSTKLTARINQEKQMAAGVEEYIWVTEGDDRVRPSHEALSGSTQKWADPPPKTGHPGTDVLCRCRAKPVLPDF